MRPVDQTTFGHPGGNCFSACVASLLHLPIENVPYFMGDPDEPGHVWAGRLDAWLEPRGFYALHFDVDPDRHQSLWPKGYFILCGKSPRGDHAVVARGSATVHDPHPLRDGLIKIEGFVLIVPLFYGRDLRLLAPTEGSSRCAHSSPACDPCVEAAIAAHST